MFCSTDEASQRLGLHRHTLQRHLREGHVPDHCFAQDGPGGAYRVNKAALAFYEANSRWPRTARELASMADREEGKALLSRLTRLEAQVARLCERYGVTPEELHV